MKTLTDSEKKVREQAILQAATAVLSGRGADAMTMDEVARQAGLAKGTLYLYYKTKEDLVQAIFSGMVEALNVKLGKLAKSDLPLEKLLDETTLALLDQFQKRRDITGYSGGMPMAGTRREALSERFSSNMHTIAAILQRCADGGLLELDDPLFAASALFGLCRGSNTYYRTAGHRLSVKQRAARVKRIFLNGTRKTR
jgi:AcrR family transcriptional regulator